MEVDEAMRWERMEKIWKDYGNYILGFVLFIILATGAVSGYQAWTHHVKIKNTDGVVALIQDSSFPDNLTPDNLKKTGSLQSLALIQAAAAQLRADKPAEALALLKQTANQTNDIDLRELAVLLQVRIAANMKSDDLTALRAPLEAIAKRSASSWQAYAALEAAALSASLDNDPTKARALLKPLLAQDNLMPSLRAKAEGMDQLYAARTATTGGSDAKP
jgi:hypothetical protein